MQSNIISLSGKISSGKDLVAKLFQRHYMIERVERGELSAQLVPSLEKCAVSNPFFGERSNDWVAKRFAGKLKKFVADILNIPVSQLDDQDYKKSILGPEWSYFETKTDFFINDGRFRKQMTVREMLIRIGDGMREKVHPDIWINALFNEWKGISIKTKYCPNCFRREAAFLTTCPKCHPVRLKEKLSYPKWIIPDMRYQNEKDRVEKLGGITIRIERPDIATINHKSETDLDSAKFNYIINNDGTLEELQTKVNKIANEISNRSIS